MADLIVLFGFVAVIAWMAHAEVQRALAPIFDSPADDVRALAHERVYRHSPDPDWGADRIYRETKTTPRRAS